MQDTNILIALVYGMMMDQVNSSAIATNRNISTMFASLQNRSRGIFRTLPDVHDGAPLKNSQCLIAL